MAEGEGGDCAPKNVPPQPPSEYVVVAAPTAVTGTAAFLDAPARKLARQLDFTGMPGHSQPQQLQQPQPQQQQQQQSVMAQQPVAALPLPPQAPHASVRVG